MPVTIRDRSKIEKALDSSLDLAQSGGEIRLPANIAQMVAEFSRQVGSATTALTNIITCLAAAAADPTVDPRYHRSPETKELTPPSGKTYFSGRGISEKVIYPWLDKNGFRTAQSGWQTRVFERPRPYTKDYPENIAGIKDVFLGILDAVATNGIPAKNVLAQFFKHEISEKERRIMAEISVAKLRPSKDVLILDIIEVLHRHFAINNSARLPVLAIQAIYEAMMPGLARYSGMKLAPLTPHSAADRHTGSIGDVQVLDKDGDPFEAIEIKHLIPIDDNIIRVASKKILTSKASRYYILTTSEMYRATRDAQSIIDFVHKKHGCQIVINGVLPSIKYYLRLVHDPIQFLLAYGKLLSVDHRVTATHLEVWRKIVSSKWPK